MKWSSFGRLLLSSVRLRLLLCYILMMLLLGSLISVLGPSLPVVAIKFGISTDSIDIVFVSRGIGFIVGVIVSSVAFDCFAGHGLIFVGLSLMSVFMGFVALSSLTNKWIWSAAWMIVGFGMAIVDLGCFTLAAWAFGKHCSAFIHMINSAFSVGSLLAPMAIAIDYQMSQSIEHVYFAMAMFCIPLMLSMIVLPSPVDDINKHVTLSRVYFVTYDYCIQDRTPPPPLQQQQQQQPEEQEDRKQDHRLQQIHESIEMNPKDIQMIEIKSIDDNQQTKSDEFTGSDLNLNINHEDPNTNTNTNTNTNDSERNGHLIEDKLVGAPKLMIGLLSIIFLLYVGLELGIGGWVSSYAIDRKLATIVSGAYLNTVFWMSATIGRLVTIPISAYASPNHIMFVCLSVTLIGSILMIILMNSMISFWLLIGLIGLALGAVPASILSYAPWYGYTIVARDNMFLMVGLALGEMIVPSVMGVVFHEYGFAMFPLCVCALSIVVWLFLIAVWFTSKPCNSIIDSSAVSSLSDSSLTPQSPSS